MKKVFGCGGLSNDNKLISFHFVLFLSFFAGHLHTGSSVCAKKVCCLLMDDVLPVTCTLADGSRKKSESKK